MKVILLEDIKGLGSMGDAVTVKEGYARNYLIPKNKARAATSANVKVLEALKKKKALAEEKVLEEAKSTAGRIAALSLTISAQAGEEEKLFGSVSSDMIAESISQEGFTVDKKDIILDEPIKKLGMYQVSVNVHPQVKASLRIWVVKK